MPYIAHDKIKEFIKLSASPDAQVKLIEPLPKALEQHGQTCKLYALSVVMNWRYISTKTAKKMPPPARKRDSKAPGQMSLRKEAKQYGSKIGEIYDPEILIEIAKNHGYENSQLIEVSANDYIANLQNAINANHPAIVYFDADPTNGDPIYSNSAHEHSAVIVGYYTDARDRLQFIANQWGGYYALDAKKCFLKLISAGDKKTIALIATGKLNAL
jgi:hypothetical protein